MKIYFSYSLSHSSNNTRDAVKQIINIIENLGHKIFPENIKEKSNAFYIHQNEDEALIAQREIAQLKKNSDIVILEVSGQSIGIGQELAFALSINKPVIALYRADSKPHILRDEGGDSLILVPYKNDDLQLVLEDAIDYASSQQDVRFNFFISPAIGNYLDWISKEKKVPRSVYLRNLIEKNMEENEEYNS